MNKIYLIPLAFAVSFCTGKKTAISKTAIASTIESVCPDNGKCSIQIISNKTLDVKVDEFGSLYYSMNDDNSKSVIVYEYNRNVKEGLQDGQHKEEIIFEINNSDTEINLTDFALQNTKMLFGRHCFCRGQGGNFKVDQGILHLVNKKGIITINLDFKVTKVPQLFTKVAASIQ